LKVSEKAHQDSSLNSIHCSGQGGERERERGRWKGRGRERERERGRWKGEGWMDGMEGERERKREGERWKGEGKTHIFK
jgi:hypothetical protein